MNSDNKYLNRQREFPGHTEDRIKITSHIPKRVHRLLIENKVNKSKVIRDFLCEYVVRFDGKLREQHFKDRS